MKKKYFAKELKKNSGPKSVKLIIDKLTYKMIQARLTLSTF